MTNRPAQSNSRFRSNLATDMLRRVNDILPVQGLLLMPDTAVEATLISAPSSSENESDGREPKMKQTRKSNKWYFGMEAHIGVDAASGLVHTVIAAAAT